MGNVFEFFHDFQMRYCMNDEATPTYSAEIENMSQGAHFILREFGPDALPTVGWHIDPFGHSSVTPSLWADIGFNAFGNHKLSRLSMHIFKGHLRK